MHKSTDQVQQINQPDAQINQPDAQINQPDAAISQLYCLYLNDRQ